MNNTSETSLQFHKITTRKEAEDFVYASYLRAASHQDYAAKDARKRHPELTRSLLWQKSVTPCIVVTGSKGKGSVSNMISRILQTRFSVGLMTSPHITDFRERFRVNNTMISESDFCRLMTEIQPEILNIASELKLYSFSVIWLSIIFFIAIPVSLSTYTSFFSVPFIKRGDI